MANRRMFSIQVVESDAFKDLAFSSQALYFHLSMNADDDGFVNSPKAIMRGIGAKSSDLDMLIKKHFVIMFDSGVLVIKHWKLNNYIRSDRYKTTTYLEEKALLTEKGNNVYTRLDTHSGIPTSETMGYPDKDSIGKDSIGKESIDTKRSMKDLVEDYSQNFRLVEAIYDFIDMRKKLKNPLTEKALKINLTKLSELTKDEEEAIKIVQQSVANGWKSFYELKKDKPKTRDEELHQLYEKYKREEEQSGKIGHDNSDELPIQDIFLLESGEF